jgi:hypothetical protein
MKTAYLEGVKVAMDAVVAHTADTPCDGQARGIWQDYFPVGFTLGEVQDAVDNFYNEPENSLIPVINALEIVSAKARGVPHDVIETKISQRRRAANDAPERK